MIRVVGIDPGLKGALCILTLNQDVEIIETKFEPMPVLGGELDGHQLTHLFGCLLDCHVFLEKVMPFRNGVAGAFNYGKGVGMLLGMLYSHKIIFTEVAPPTWQKVMHQGINRTTIKDAKQRSLAAARRLFPNVELRKQLQEKMSKFPDEGYVDALLIAEFGRRYVKGNPKTL